MYNCGYRPKLAVDFQQYTQLVGIFLTNGSILHVEKNNTPQRESRLGSVGKNKTRGCILENMVISVSKITICTTYFLHFLGVSFAIVT